GTSPLTVSLWTVLPSFRLGLTFEYLASLSGFPPQPPALPIRRRTAAFPSHPQMELLRNSENALDLEQRAGGRQLHNKTRYRIRLLPLPVLLALCASFFRRASTPTATGPPGLQRKKPNSRRRMIRQRGTPGATG